MYTILQCHLADTPVLASRFIIMEADTTLSPWSKICISHADCILLVGTPDTSPEVGAMVMSIYLLDHIAIAPVTSTKDELTCYYWMTL